MIHRFLLSLSLLLFITACQNKKEQSEEIQISVADFDTFLNLEHGCLEEELPSKLGKFTGGFFLEDSSTFVYQFNEVNQVPISVWVDAKTGVVTTVLIEVLSEVNQFEKEINKAVEVYHLNKADVDWFGMSESELIAILGEPTSRLDEAGELTTLNYLSEDNKIALSFSFYEEQDAKCSALMLNWLYL
jgi:hypothetical protein